MLGPTLRTKDIETRAAQVGTFDAKTRTQQVTFFTQPDTIKCDLDGQQYIERWHPEGCDLTRANGAGVSLFFNHANGATPQPVLLSQRDVIGAAVPGSWILTAERGECTVRYIAFAEDESDVEDDKRAAMKVAHGYSTGISPGFRMIETRVEADSGGGLPVLHVLRSEILELSAAPIQADAGASTRTMEVTMPAAAIAPNQPTTEDVATRAAAEETERTRIREEALVEGARHGTAVRALCHQHGLDIDAAATDGEPAALTSLRAAVGDPKVAMPRVRELVLDALATCGDQTAIRGLNVVGTRDEGETSVRVLDACLSQRAHLGLSAEEASMAREGASMRWTDIARRCLELGGTSTRGMGEYDIIAAALHQPKIAIRAGEMQTGDFPSVTANLMNKFLKGERAITADYEWFKDMGYRRDLPDYKPATVVDYGGFGTMPEVKEGAEYQRVTFGDEKIQWGLVKRGFEFALTEELIRNNDLDGFLRLLRQALRSSMITESAVAAAAFTSNPTMGDGVALFTSGGWSWSKNKRTNNGGHANVGTAGSATTISNLVARINELGLMLRIQVDRDGAVVGQPPAHWFGPADYYSILEQVYSDQYRPIDPSLVVTVPIAQTNRHYVPSLAGTKPMYLVSTDNLGLEYGYLQGEGGLVVPQYAEPKTDGIVWHARHVFGCRVVDPRPFAVNMGA